jgi:tetratricopeptide (TPR) repeat protein
MARAASDDSPEVPFDAALVNDLADGRLDSYSLADAALIASGVDSEEHLSIYRQRLDKIVEEAVARSGTSSNLQRRAQRLLAALHYGPLRRYDAGVDRLMTLVDQGVYNCVSATLLYAIAARRAGLPVEAVETPLHVFIVLDTGMRRIEIEPTSPQGFDTTRDLLAFRSFVLANKYATPEEIAQRGIESIFDEFRRLSHPIPAEQVIALLYQNAGTRALQAGDAAGAVRMLVNAARIYPDLAYRSENLRNTMAWSIREKYDANRLDEAFNLAELSMKLFPDRVTVRDRFVAVAARAVEEAAAHGDLQGAQNLEQRALGTITDEEIRRRLEVYTAPAMARAALAVRDAPAARRHAARFRAVSPDTSEAERFERWIEDQVQDGSVEMGLLDAELRQALATTPEGTDPSQYAALVRGTWMLAAAEKYDEALAVGRMQRSFMTDQAASGFDALLKGITQLKVTQLVRARRYREAGQTLSDALLLWPADADLVALHHEAARTEASDPWRLQTWPAAGRKAAASIAVGSPWHPAIPSGSGPTAATFRR